WAYRDQKELSNGLGDPTAGIDWGYDYVINTSDYKDDFGVSGVRLDGMSSLVTAETDGVVSLE
ncbi:unnamed protein product, partial [Durusdinium trenchii]